METQCLICTKHIINKRKNRLQKFCSHSCATTYRHRNNGLTTFGVENWKLRKYAKKATICELCGREEVTNSTNKGGVKTSPNQLSRDHDHKTGNFRGMLCSPCNRGLGWFEKNQESVFKYLDKTKDFKVIQKNIDSVITQNHGIVEGSIPF